MIKIKCIKDVYTDNTQYLSEFDVEEAMSFPIIRLFTKDKMYDVNVVGDEWRTKDDDCNTEEIEYNHIVKNATNGVLDSWFLEHFVIVN